MQNVIARSALIAIIVLASAEACAGPTAELKVQGTIKAPVCTPALSSGGVIDYGVIPSASLSTADSTMLPERNLSFSISCDAPAKLAIKIADNRSGTAVSGLVGKVHGNGGYYDDNYAFGLGVVAGKKVGAYVIKIAQGSFKGDGVNLDTISSVNGSGWRKPPAGSGDLREMTSWAPVGSYYPTPYKSVTGTLTVGVVIDKAGNLPLTQEVPLSGSATLEVTYL